MGRLLSDFLTAEGIENRLEVSIETDWGSSKYGDVASQIWIIDEDQVSAAQRWVEMFQKDSNNPIFHPSGHKKILTPPLLAESQVKADSLKLIKPAPSVQAQNLSPLGKITLYLLIVCCALFLATEFTEPQITVFPPTLPPTALFSPLVKKVLLYDYPHAFEIVDKLVALYGIDRLQNPADLPSEGQYLLKQYYKTPYWTGYYDKIVSALQPRNEEAKKQAAEDVRAPLFEKLRQGEVWRLFTPCLLHGGILHILFNMLWLIVLGKQLEMRLGSWRYIVFVALTGVFSNTAQYLMGGPNFIGFSGILCAMLTFIWARQRIAAWEGYQLDGMTMGFMMFFIFSMFAIQGVSFYLEIHNQASITPGIANTAHISGAIIGYVLGRIPFFSWKL